MAHRIDTTSGRKLLKARREPYWTRVESGAFIGFRKLAEGEGTWVARWRDEQGQQHYHALGHHADYDSAARAARLWFVHCAGGSPTVVSVEAACRRCV